MVERGGMEAVPSREIGGRVPGTKEVEGQLGVGEEFVAKGLRGKRGGQRRGGL